MPAARWLRAFLVIVSGVLTSYQLSGDQQLLFMATGTCWNCQSNGEAFCGETRACSGDNDGSGCASCCTGSFCSYLLPGNDPVTLCSDYIANELTNILVCQDLGLNNCKCYATGGPTTITSTTTSPFFASAVDELPDLLNASVTSGEASRTVDCNTADMVACNATGARPAAARACSDESGCPGWNALCPAGEDAGLSCSAQLATGSVILVLLLISVPFIICCKRRWLLSRYARRALERIGELPDEQLVCGFPVCWSFYFLPRAWFLSYDQRTPLPCWQTLYDQDVLEMQSIDLASVLNQSLSKTHAAISYRWAAPSHPDQDKDHPGQRVLKIKLLLQKNKDIQWVWMDWCCLPQAGGKKDQRTPLEKNFFKKSLEMINMLYLSCAVFVIFDQQYTGRFWPCIESWMGMQAIAAGGIRPQEDPTKVRLQVECIGGAEGTNKAAFDLLHATLALQSPSKIIERLSHKDIVVTNRSDKDTQLRKIQDLDQRIAELYVKLVVGVPSV